MSKPTHPAQRLIGQQRIDEGFFGYFARHGTAANILALLAVLAGVWAMLNLRTQLFPDVEINSLSISAVWEGASAADVDESLIRPLQDELQLVDGVSAVSGVAREGRASLTVTFDEGHDLNQGQLDVQAALSKTSALPEGAEAPEIVTGRFLDSVSRIVFSADGDLGYLINRAEQLQSELYSAGLEQVDITGIRTPNVDIELDPVRLRELRLTPGDIANALRTASQDSPGGAIEEGARTVRTEATRRSLRDFESVTVKRLADGTAIALSEVARIAKGYPGDAIQQFRNEKGAIELIIQRGVNGDAVRQQIIVADFIERYRQGLPDGAAIENYAIEAEGVSARIELLVRNGIQGSLIVLVLLFLFLNARVAIWVAVGIPVSIAATLAVMYASGQTLNMISMFALIISLGIIVDDALVVGEHAYELNSRGLGPRAASILAAKRMFMPVLASAATTVVAFASISLLGGRFGSILGVMPLAVSAVVIASLLECFLVLPAHMGHALASRPPKRRHLGVRLREAINGGVDWVRFRAFPPLVRAVIFARYPVVAALVVAVLLSTALVRNGTVGSTFFSFPEGNSVTSNLTMVEIAQRSDTLAMLTEMERAVQVTLDQIGQNPETPTKPKDVVMVITTYGLHQGFRGYSSPDVATQRAGSIRIELVDSDQRSFSTFDFSEAWSANVQRSPLVQELSSRGGRRGGGGDGGLTLALIGDDIDVLKAVSLEVQAAAGAIDIISEASDDTDYGDPEIELRLTPLGERLGFDPVRVGSQVRDLIRENEASRFVENGEEIAVRLFLPEAERTLSRLRRQELLSPAGEWVPLKEIVSISERQGFSAIRSQDSARQISVSLTYDQDKVSASAVAERIERDVLPGLRSRFDFETKFGGDLADEQEAQSDLILAGLACLAGIYLIIAWTFGSFTRPLIILLVVPLGVIGTVLGHWSMGVTATIFSAIGLIGLAGIIVNDSIVLISTIDERRRTQPLIAAIVDGTADRLRAVFLTSATTVGGLGPLLFETSRAAVFLKPTVVTITWGLGLGTVLLLLFVPAAVAIQADIGQQVMRLRVMLAWWLGRRTRFSRDSALGV